MTNFPIKYTSCVSKISRVTDLEIKIAKNTDIFAYKATRVNYKIQVLFCLHNIIDIWARFINISPTQNTQKKSITNSSQHKFPSKNVISFTVSLSAVLHSACSVLISEEISPRW